MSKFRFQVEINGVQCVVTVKAFSSEDAVAMVTATGAVFLSSFCNVDGRWQRLFS